MTDDRELDWSGLQSEREDDDERQGPRERPRSLNLRPAPDEKLSVAVAHQEQALDRLERDIDRIISDLHDAADDKHEAPKAARHSEARRLLPTNRAAQPQSRTSRPGQQRPCRHLPLRSGPLRPRAPRRLPPPRWFRACRPHRHGTHLRRLLFLLPSRRRQTPRPPIGKQRSKPSQPRRSLLPSCASSSRKLPQLK